MVESGMPNCPNCGEGFLVPFSVSQIKMHKTFAHWICFKCGFCVGTGDSRGYNIPKDIDIRIIPQIVEKVRKAKEENHEHR